MRDPSYPIHAVGQPLLVHWTSRGLSNDCSRYTGLSNDSVCDSLAPVILSDDDPSRGIGRLVTECTKGFFQYFRAKHANMNIEELKIIEDWDNPVSTDSTDDPDTIKAQIHKYYEWLYRAKTTNEEHDEELLAHMSGNPIPENIAKSADAKIKLDDVIEAIRKTANNKSPGPDGLPGEFYRAFEMIIAQPLKDSIMESQ